MGERNGDGKALAKQFLMIVEFGGGGILSVARRGENFRDVRARKIEKRARFHVIANRRGRGADILYPSAHFADAVPSGQADGGGKQEPEHPQPVQFLANRNRHSRSLLRARPRYCSLRTTFTVSSTSSFFTKPIAPGLPATVCFMSAAEAISFGGADTLPAKAACTKYCPS